MNEENTNKGELLQEKMNSSEPEALTFDNEPTMSMEEAMALLQK